jgi:hypothetical protein
LPRSFSLCGIPIYPGETREIELQVGELYTSSPIAIPVRVVRGWSDGPRLFVTAAVHGDEINGTEVIRELVYDVNLSTLRGILVCVPVVNLHGFLNRTRYLPDRRDLNRSFPGNSRGSPASRLADQIFTEIVRRCQFGIDLHTASAHKINLPHVRADLRHPLSRRLALAFGSEIVVNAPASPRSLRGAAHARSVPVLTYEGGEPLRFQRDAVERGLDGILNVMSALGMIDRKRGRPPFQIVARRRAWVRAAQGGILDLRVRPGDLVHKGEEIGVKTNPFGRERATLVAPFTGLVLGATTLPTVSPGDAVVHIVKLTSSRSRIETLLEGRNLLDIGRAGP